MQKDFGKIANFSETFEEIEVFAKIFQNFIFCREIPGRSQIDFWRDYQQILKKHKYFTRTIREISNNSTNIPFLRKLMKLYTYFWITNKLIKG